MNSIVSPCCREKRRGSNASSPFPLCLIKNLGISAVFCSQFLQAGIGGTLADGAEFPFAVVTIDLTENQGGHAGVIIGQIILQEFSVVPGIYDADKGIADHTKGLTALNGLIDVHHHHNAINVCGNTIQINDDLLVITGTCTGQVVTHMLDGSGSMTQIAEINDILAQQKENENEKEAEAEETPEAVSSEESTEDGEKA